MGVTKYLYYLNFVLSRTCFETLSKLSLQLQKRFQWDVNTSISISPNYGIEYIFFASCHN